MRWLGRSPRLTSRRLVAVDGCDREFDVSRLGPLTLFHGLDWSGEGGCLSLGSTLYKIIGLLGRGPGVLRTWGMFSFTGGPGWLMFVVYRG